MERRITRALAWRAIVLATAAPIAGFMGAGSLAAAPTQGVAAGSESAPATLASATTSVTVEEQLAQARLSANMRAPHPGRPETLAHPAADHMSGRRPVALTAPGTGAGAGASLAAAIQPAAAISPPGEPGLDVSSYQGNVDWAGAKANGATFAFIKATEGTYYTDSSYFAQQYNGSYNAGLIRGSYHFAIPNNSTGAAQADYFVANGGGWSADGHTLPGTLDIEYNPYGAECYGLTPSQMVSWIQSFDSEYKVLTGRYPTIYTTTGWWSACTGNSSEFGQEGLAVANYGGSPGTLPASWSAYDIWQYADSGVFPGDQDVFNGSYDQLLEFSIGPSVAASAVPLACGTAGDLRSEADASVRTGVVVSSNGGYQTDTVDDQGNLQPIPTSVPSPGTPIAAVWQNSTDCAGDAQSRNAWAVAPNGAVYGESSQAGPPAQNFGDASKLPLVKPVVGMSPTSDAGGYWLVASDGGVFSYGDARFHGSTGGVKLVKPIVGMATTPDGGGYWMAASDGGVFAFGDARFYGSLGGVNLVEPIEAMVATPDGGGYWMVASDGGVFCFGDAVFRGSMGGHQLSAPIAGMIPNGDGYTLIGQDGKTYPFA